MLNSVATDRSSLEIYNVSYLTNNSIYSIQRSIRTIAHNHNEAINKVKSKLNIWGIEIIDSNII